MTLEEAIGHVQLDYEKGAFELQIGNTVEACES